MKSGREDFLGLPRPRSRSGESWFKLADPVGFAELAFVLVEDLRQPENSFENNNLLYAGSLGASEHEAIHFSKTREKDGKAGQSNVVRRQLDHWRMSERDCRLAFLDLVKHFANRFIGNRHPVMDVFVVMGFHQRFEVALARSDDSLEFIGGYLLEKCVIANSRNGIVELGVSGVGEEKGGCSLLGSGERPDKSVGEFNFIQGLPPGFRQFNPFRRNVVFRILSGMSEVVQFFHECLLRQKGCGFLKKT